MSNLRIDRGFQIVPPLWAISAHRHCHIRLVKMQHSSVAHLKWCGYRTFQGKGSAWIHGLRRPRANSVHVFRCWNLVHFGLLASSVCPVCKWLAHVINKNSNDFQKYLTREEASCTGRCVKTIPEWDTFTNSCATSKELVHCCWLTCSSWLDWRKKV